MSSEDVINALKSDEGKAALWSATIGQDRIQGYTADGKPIPENPADPTANDMTVASAITLAARFERTGMAAFNEVLGKLAGIESTLSQLAAEVDQVDEQTVAGIFGQNDAQLISILREAVGAERLASLAEQILGDVHKG